MNEVCCCITVDEYSVVLSCHHPTARKHHKCCECGGVISPGETYERTVTLFEGFVDTYKTCGFREAIRRDFFPCGFYHGRMREDFLDCNGWDYCEMPEEDDDV